MSNDVDFTSVARMTEGLSGSDLKELCRLAAMLRVREYVQRHDVDNLSRCVRVVYASHKHDS